MGLSAVQVPFRIRYAGYGVGRVSLNGGILRSYHGGDARNHGQPRVMYHGGDAITANHAYHGGDASHTTRNVA